MNKNAPAIICFSPSRGRHDRRAKKGLALASILMIVGIVLLIALSLGSISMFQLNLATKLSNDTKARMAAESELNNVLLSLIKSPAYGPEQRARGMAGHQCRNHRNSQLQQW